MPPRSRHDHYPRADRARCRAIGRAAAGLATAWRRADDAPGGLLAAFDAAADLAPAATIERLLPWLDDPRWLGERVAQGLALLAADPFARPPLRLVGGGGGPAGLVLAERGAISLSIQLQPFEAAAPPPATALFVPGHAAIRVLAPGAARLTLHHVAVTAAEEAGGFTAAAAARCHSDPPHRLAGGELYCLDTARTAFTLAGATGDILFLELAVRPPSPLPMRVHALAGGALVHVAASRRDSSFRQMALALLRAMERTDAVPLFAEATYAEDFAARWSAMRDLVALDAATARPRLAEMAADDPHPEIRAAAAATLALFVAPERRPCPA